MYEISGEDPHFYAWAADPANAHLFPIVLAWLPLFAQDPHGWQTALKFRKDGQTCFTACVPETDVFVDYTVIEDPPIIVIIGVKTERMVIG